MNIERHRMHALPVVLFVVGSGLFALAAVLYTARGKLDSQLIVGSEPDREVAADSLSKELPVVYRFENTGRHAMRVVGLTQC